jgi:hypothetical protein
MRAHQKILSALQGCVWLLLMLLLVTACARSGDQPEPITASIEIQIPCTDPLQVGAGVRPNSGGPYLIADPPCGTLSELDGTPGTEISLRGSGFYPDTQVELL